MVERAGNEVESHDPGEDVRLVIEQTGEWIRSADAKTGLLGAALAVLVSAIAAKFDRPHIAHWSDFPGDAIKAALLAATMLSIVKSAYHMKGVLVPRTPPGAEETRYSWPRVADLPIDQLTALPAANSRREAWVQAKTLSIIAKVKHHQFILALRWSAIATALFLMWVGALTRFK
ncbi:hypothetical protein [Streptomyces sp. NBC_00183]|uniref:hypothetical protein n=1 Tax=Streptomyces sp. NBC_00183 TaxID=2903633 RepID=UPI00225657B5|nr:hypothetical protein [Streptomyces sp. NBC_00183]MCX5293635.1 hypothetical protein [Streptomyces sp. NBC_00183]